MKVTRYKGQLWEVYHDISLEESLKKIANEQTFGRRRRDKKLL